jgi:hypothetical protein
VGKAQDSFAAAWKNLEELVRVFEVLRQPAILLVALLFALCIVRGSLQKPPKPQIQR